MVRKVITDKDFSKTADCNCILAMLLKNCEPEHFIYSSWYFQCILKEPCSPHDWKVSSVVPEFKNVGKRSVAKNYHPLSLRSVVSKPSENNSLVHFHDSYTLSSNFQNGLRSSYSTAGLLTDPVELLRYLTVWD